MKKNNAGFTLIEVMVAVGVIAIAIPATLLAMMSQIDGAAHMRDKMQAQWVAENVLEEVRIRNRINGAVPEESSSGDTELVGRTWQYKMRSKAFPQAELSDIYGVEVSVWTQGNVEDQPLVKLVGIVRKYVREPIIRPQSGGSITPPPPVPGVP